MSATRYDIETSFNATATKLGDYVEASDYLELEKEHEAANDRITSLEEQISSYEQEIKDLNEQLKERSP